MTHSTAVELLRTALWTSVWLSAPALIAGFAAGIVISLAQIITSIQDSSFSTVPRLMVFFGALLLAMPWMITRLLTYTTALFGNLERYAR